MSLKLMSTVISTSLPQTRNKPAADSSDKILKQLLECVQECQKRYGGKTELATEFDGCVIALCLTLEAVLLHGIKVSKKSHNQESSQLSSTLKQVSGIVANSLNIGNEVPSCWSFVKSHLTKHEQERYAVLKHIKTDIGRSRAWIRSALNERSLERYCHILLSNPDILKRHYEDWALLRDQEKSSMLPNMAAGLGAILFALSIDKAELNNGTPARLDALKVKSEPIIEAPIPENKQRSSKDKKKRKVARQFISFDDDDDTMYSTSANPSLSSGSSTGSSDGNSTTEISKNPAANNKLIQITEESKIVVVEETSDDGAAAAAAAPPTRKLSVESGDSHEKFVSEPLDTLTPMAQSEIGELTPVFVEINAHFESPADVSDDLLEIPTDISAVLTTIETKNREELSKKQDKIDALTKENASMKEQMKKYVGAIQMIRRDEDGGLQKALEGLQIEPQPDYQGEAKLFEQKLVQVAEMHAELMDFNVALQQQLCQKDALLERLKSELEELRGPMPTDELAASSDIVRGSVSVWIPSAFLTGTGSNSHHVYQIFLRAGSDEWNIYRRYAQFYALHADLKKLDPSISSFDFPPKKSIGKKDSALVEERRKRLQVYLRRVLAHWPELTHCNSRFLLEQHLAFFKDQKENDQKNRGIFSPRRSRISNDNHYTGL